MKRMDQLLTITTALLSSSCCLLQLVLNLFSFSCAGFAIFTPYRPWLTALTLILVTANTIRLGLRRTWVSIVITMLIIASPEIVHWFNVTPGILAPTGAGCPLAAVTTKTTVLRLEGLGCIACANRIKHALQAAEWVKTAMVFFDNRSAVVVHHVVEQDTRKMAAAAQDLIELVRSVDPKYNAWIVDA